MACDATEDDGTKYSRSRCAIGRLYDYDPTATIDNPEWCEYADAGYDCDGNCDGCRWRRCMRRV